MTSTIKKTTKLTLYAISALFLISVFISLVPGNAKAVSASDWKPGRIIDDAVFFNKDAMNPQQIQEFLNSKVPVCDTWHNWSGWVNGVWNAPPYTCLKDFSENGKSAAQIIWEAGQNHGINPQVLIATLQKETALVTDPWAAPWQYQRAMGYACPDTADCNSQYYGFTNQVHTAAWQFKRYTLYPDSYNFKAGVTRNIRWSPNADCGSSPVYIESQGTAALYNYTPYQPNSAALNNMYGTGDGCSAYGNRNFWRIFNDWFGSSKSETPQTNDIVVISAFTTSPTNPIATQPFSVSYTVQNVSTKIINIESTVLQCRYNTHSNCDPAWGPNSTIIPGEQKTFSSTINANGGGDYLLTPFMLINGVWYKNGLSSTANTNFININIPDLRITTPITLNPVNPTAGQPTTISFNVRNFDSRPISLQSSVIQCRLKNEINCDSNYGSPITLGPGESYNFAYGATVPYSGDYILIPYYLKDGLWYTYGVSSNSISSSLSLYTPDLRLTEPISLTPNNPIPGQSTTASYTVKNYGDKPAIYQTSILQCRYKTYTNCDPNYGPPITINPGEQRTFSETFSALKAGTYTITPYFSQNDKWYNYGVSGAATNNSSTLIVPEYVADLRLTEPISLTPNNPIPGQSTTASYTVKNYGDKPAIYQTSILQCRYKTYTNCDPNYGPPITINPGEQRTFSETFSALKAGTYTITPYFSQNDKWYNYGVSGAYQNSIIIYL